MKTDRKPVTCVSCGITFISVLYYLHPTHRCAVTRHPSNINREKGHA